MEDLVAVVGLVGDGGGGGGADLGDLAGGILERRDTGFLRQRFGLTQKSHPLKAPNLKLVLA